MAQLPGYLNPVADLTRSGLQSMTDEERKALESSLTSVKVSAGQSAEASLRLERAAEIDGVVQYDDGSPAIGLNVVLKSAKEGADKRLTSIDFPQAVSSTNGLLRRTDDRGHFRILGIAPGHYLVVSPCPPLAGNSVFGQSAHAGHPDRDGRHVIGVCGQHHAGQHCESHQDRIQRRKQRCRHHDTAQ